jgi:hypothetical protein
MSDEAKSSSSAKTPSADEDETERAWLFLSVGTALFVAVTCVAVFVGPVASAGVGLSGVMGLWAYTQQQEEEVKRLRAQDKGHADGHDNSGDQQ